MIWFIVSHWVASLLDELIRKLNKYPDTIFKYDYFYTMDFLSLSLLIM